PPNTIENRNEASFLNVNVGEGQKLGNNNIRSLLEDREGRIWVGSYEGGVYLLNPPNNCEDFFQCSPADFNFLKIKHNNAPKEEDLDLILSLFLDSENNLWVGYFHGLVKLSLDSFVGQSANEIQQKAEFDNINFNAVLTIGTTNKHINNIFQDKSGIVWFASTKGVYKYFGNQLKFDIQLNEYTESNSTSVISFLEHKNGEEVWIGTTKKGLLNYNKSSKEIKKYNFKSSNGKVLSYITSIFEDRQGTLWLGTSYGELFSFRLRNGTPIYKHYPIPHLNKLEVGNTIWKITQDRKGNLWIGSHKGLIRYDIASETITPFVPNLNNPNSLYGENVFDILEDKQGILWIATAGGGLNRLDWKSDSDFQFKLYAPEATNPNSIKSNIVFDIELVNNSIWIGSQSGIQEYNIEQDSFYTHKILENSISGQILGISHDSQERIWFSNNDGLFSYNKQGDILSHYQPKQGLVNSFEFRSNYTAPDGKIYFGGINGFNSFYGKDIVSPNFSNLIQITNLKITGKSIRIGQKDEQLGYPILQKSITKTDAITLSYNHQLITFEYAVLDFLSTNQYQYAYKLEGFDSNWVQAGKQNSTTYTNIPPGAYTFKIKAKNNEGVWCKPIQLRVNVQPPFWKTWWFLITCISIFFIALILLQRQREEIIMHRNEELEQKVKERTSALKDNISQLKEKEIVLEEKNIELQKYISSNSDLENFAYIASHDLRAPLANIIGLADIIKMTAEGKLDEEEQEMLGLINLSAQNMIRLTEDLLTYSRANSQKQKIEKVELGRLLELLLHELNTSIEENKATIKLHNIPREIQGDYSQLRQLFQNLIANAIKFARPNIPPKVVIKATDRGDDWLFMVKDNGVGIRTEYLDKIFLLFKKLHDNSEYEGTGIGLSTCKTIVERHDGIIWVESTQNEGSAFYFSISKKLKLHSNEIKSTIGFQH
ncbi:MAG: two-component regulator propeller domain-containing protein, partial [Chitinophagales bacterium]